MEPRSPYDAPKTYTSNGTNTPKWKPDTTWMVGNVLERYMQLDRKNFQWHSFYNGWLEGRFQMLKDLNIYEKEKEDE